MPNRRSTATVATRPQNKRPTKKGPCDMRRAIETEIPWTDGRAAFHDRTYEEQTSERSMGTALRRLTDGLEWLREEDNEGRRRWVGDVALKHPLRGPLLRNSLTRRAFEKPREFAGEAELLDLICFDQGLTNRLVDMFIDGGELVLANLSQDVSDAGYRRRSWPGTSSTGPWMKWQRSQPSSLAAPVRTPAYARLVRPTSCIRTSRRREMRTSTTPSPRPIRCVLNPLAARASRGGPKSPMKRLGVG